MRSLIAFVLLLATAPVRPSGGSSETSPNGWSTTGPLTSEVGIQTTSREPEDALLLTERLNGSSSAGTLKSGQDIDADDGIAPRLASAQPAEEAQREGDQSEGKVSGGLPSAVKPDKKFRRNAAKLLSLGLLVVAMTFIARVFSSKFAFKEGVGTAPAAASEPGEGSPESEAELISSASGSTPLEERAQHSMGTSQSGVAHREPAVVDLEQSITQLNYEFRRAAIRAEMWSNRSESALLSSRVAGGDGPGVESTAKSLALKMSSIASSLAQNVGAVCAGLDKLNDDIKRARTLEQAAEAAASLRALLRALDNIGGSAAAEFFRVVEATATMTNQAKMLLDMYPDILVLANNLAQPLGVPYASQPAFPTSAAGLAGDVTLANLKALVDEVSVTEALQSAKMQKVLESSLVEPHFGGLVQLLWRSRELQDDMQATVKSLVHAQRSLEVGSLPSPRLNVSAAIEVLKAIKAKQMALGEEMKLELDVCVELALEQLEAARVLVEKNEDGRWKKSAHPLLSMARIIKKHIASVEVALSNFEDSAGEIYL
ncbi:uncharacterized protein EMH_0022020 [Eimeria mitis]|uniref:Transmembrane protein n=1 Tax=Eimeria mitis TaxID=44415 RepID=U6JZL0_9EIME|nr:uncharacterized protein EMH_0022020 [Eimeria mitis]CDJ29502.1 hypothetical protein, conserved [Eimeria mitis]